MSENQQVATRQEGRPIEIFRNDLGRALPTIQKLLPAHVTVEKFEAMVVGAVLSNPDLLKADRATLMQAVADTADLGLSLNKQMREADILLVQGKAQMRPRYEGIAKLAIQSGEIIDIYAHEVYVNDYFHYDLGLNKTLEHRPAEGDRGELANIAYCVWTTKHGVKGFEVITSTRIARAKAASEGYKAFKAGKIKSTPWVTDEAQMQRKTAIRAASPYMPKSTESDKFQRALMMSDDTQFEDDHVGVPSEPRIMAPRPTREQNREATESMRKEQVGRERQYREAMQQENPEPESEPEPEQAVEQPKAEEPKAPKQQPAKRDIGGDPRPEPPMEDVVIEQAPQRQERQQQQASTQEHEATERVLRRKMTEYKTSKLFSGPLGDYQPEMSAMKSGDPKRYAKLVADIVAKWPELKSRVP